MKALVNRTLYLLEVLGQTYKINDLEIHEVTVPDEVDLESKGLASVDQILIAFRDGFGHRKIPADKRTGQYPFTIYVRGVKSQCVAEYVAIGKVFYIVSCKEVDHG